jgi:hypothetical protein
MGFRAPPLCGACALECIKVAVRSVVVRRSARTLRTLRSVRQGEGCEVGAVEDVGSGGTAPAAVAVRCDLRGDCSTRCSLHAGGQGKRRANL